MSEEFKPITIESQEEMDNLFKSRLGRESEKHRKEIEALKASYADYEELKAMAEGRSTEVEDLKAQLEEVTSRISGYDSLIAEKDKRIKEYETDALKTKVLTEYGLSIEAKGFLQGEDEESLKASAESLKSLVGSSRQAPLASGDPRSGGTKEASNSTAYKQLLNQFIQ